MKSRRDAFGRACWLVSLVALYALLGLKAYVFWREGLWPQWPLGEYVPDAVVRAAFSGADSPARAALAWLLGRDVLYFAAAASLVLWMLDFFGGSSGDDGGTP